MSLSVPAIAPRRIVIPRPDVSRFRDNAALASLPDKTFARLAHDLAYREIPPGNALWDDGIAERVHFPLSGVVAATRIAKHGPDELAIEVASIGSETLAEPRPGSCGVALTYVTCCWLPAAAFKAAAETDKDVRRLADQSRAWSLAQAEQLVACTATHQGEARFCRWLLGMHDRVQKPLIGTAITQDLIGELLGMRRTTITVIADAMRQEGAIAYRRGKMEIRDRNLLERWACSCRHGLGPANWPFKR